MVYLRKHVYKNVELFYSSTQNKLFINGYIANIGIFMPSYFFFKQEFNYLSFIFLSKFVFGVFKTQFNLVYQKLNRVFFLKFRLKGLGFRTYFVSSSIMYFFFNYSNYFYFFRPSNVFVKRSKKRVLILSNDWCLLRIIALFFFSLKK